MAPTLAGEPSLSRSWGTQGLEGAFQYPSAAQESRLLSLSWRVGARCAMLVMEVAKGPEGRSQEQYRELGVQAAALLATRGLRLGLGQVAATQCGSRIEVDEVVSGDILFPHAEEGYPLWAVCMFVCVRACVHMFCACACGYAYMYIQVCTYTHPCVCVCVWFVSSLGLGTYCGLFVISSCATFKGEPTVLCVPRSRG